MIHVNSTRLHGYKMGPEDHAVRTTSISGGDMKATCMHSPDCFERLAS